MPYKFPPSFLGTLLSLLLFVSASAPLEEVAAVSGEDSCACMPTSVSKVKFDEL